MKKLYIVGLGPGGGQDMTGRAKAALEAAGYIATVDIETYDRETGRTQIALLAECVGAEYG